MVRRPIPARKRVPNPQTYIHSLIGQMVYALGGNFYGIIRSGEAFRCPCLLVRKADWFTERVWAVDIGLEMEPTAKLKGLQLERDGALFGTVISAGDPLRIRIKIESSDGKDVEAWADECGTHEHAARVMRMGITLQRIKPRFTVTDGH